MAGFAQRGEPPPRLVRAMAAEQHATWQESTRYVNMRYINTTLLKDLKRARLQAVA